MCRIAILVAVTALATFRQDACPESLIAKRGQSNPASRAERSEGQLDSLRAQGERCVAKAKILRRAQTVVAFNAAIKLLEESIRLFQAGHLYSQSADAHLQIGEIHFASSRYEKALDSYRAALNLASNGEQRCRILSHITRTYANFGHSSEAAVYSQRASDACAGILDAKIQGEVWEARGEALQWSGDSEKAVEFLSRARDLFIEAKDDDGQALALLMLAEALFLPDREQSLRLALQALRTGSGAGNKYGAAQASAFLASINAVAGQYENSRCYADEAQQVFQKAGDWDSVAITLNTMGFVAMQTGDPERSLEYFRRARAFFLKAQDQLGEPEAISGQSRALLALGRRSQLPALYAEKLKLGQKTRNANLKASAIGDMGGLLETQHRYKEAEQHYHDSIRGYREVPNPRGEGTFLIRLAHLYGLEGRDSEAISLLEQAYSLKEKAGQVEELARIGYEEAFIYRRQGRLREALDAIQKTVSIIESQRETLAVFDLRASYFASVHQYYALYIQILMLLQRQDPDPSLVAAALQASEKSKVRSLIDWLAGFSEKDSCGELFRKQELAAASKQPFPVEVSLSERFPSLTPPEIQAQLAGDDAILIEYALGDEKSYLWVVDSQHISSYELPGIERISSLVQGLRTAINAQPSGPEESKDQYLAKLAKARRDYDRYTSELGKLLLAPVDSLAARRIIVVPDGPLQYVPFAGLPVDRRHPKTFLGTSHEVIILPSVSALSAIRSAANRRPAPTAVAAVIANPVFDRNDPRVRRPNVGQEAGNRQAPSLAVKTWRDVEPKRPIPPLIASHLEAEAVRALGRRQGEVFVAEGFLASRSTVLDGNLGRYRFIHFATHGVLDVVHPERAGLILSLVGKNGEPKDGFLRLSDIYSLKLSADLVVLSACDSGLGKDLSSEGIIGLPRAFLRAGAKSVIVTLWKVEDNATAALMTHFYQHLRHGETPAAALREAQAAMAHDPLWSDPYYWSAFAFQGDYR